MVTSFSHSMDATYHMKHLGFPSFMLGLKIRRSEDALHLSQEQYIADVAAKFGVVSSVPAPTPANPTGTLATTPDSSSPLLDTDRYPYLSLIGSLLWVSLTRPDVATAVSKACQRSKSPTVADWRAARRILSYLYHSRTLGLRYSTTPRPPTVSAFVDASWGNERNGKSRYGFVVMLAGSPISWVTKTTTMVCLSTAESEFVAASEACKDVMWARGLLGELGMHQSLSLIHI